MCICVPMCIQDRRRLEWASDPLELGLHKQLRAKVWVLGVDQGIRKDVSWLEK